MMNLKPKIYKDLKQGDPEWFEVRKGITTGSVMKSALGGPQAQETLAYEKIAERYVDDSVIPTDWSFSDEYLAERITSGEPLRAQDVLDRGHELEEYAKYLYMKKTKSKVYNIGFVKISKHLGCSPDGLIKSGRSYVGAIEVKCPLGKNFVKYISQGVIPKEYKGQVLNYFICLPKLKYLDFIIYHPGASKKLGTFHIMEFTREQLQEDIDNAIRKLNSLTMKMDSIEDTLLSKYSHNEEIMNYDIEGDGVYTLQQVADVLGLSRRTIQNKCRSGEIKSVNVGTPKRANYRIPGEAILNYLKR